MNYYLLNKLLKEMIISGADKEVITKFFLRKSNKITMRKRLYILRKLYKVK